MTNRESSTESSDGLTSSNDEVIEGYHGFHGIWRGITEQPDAIITDINMPYANGEQVIECLKSNPNTTHLLVLTGVSDPSLRRRLRKLVVDRFFAKPADVNELLCALNEYLNLNIND